MSGDLTPFEVFAWTLALGIAFVIACLALAAGILLVRSAVQHKFEDENSE